ncbi:MAG: molybdopterin cofactor-binding domain-containing protein, partial [Pseudomonadota bacterium]
MTLHANRRQFLTAAGGLTLGLFLPLNKRAAAQSGVAGVIQADEPVATTFEPNAFIRIATDDTVTVLVKHIEFGQGTYTGLSTLVAEELDADWDQMRAVSAPADAEIYANTLFGLQGTGGSTAIANSYMQMRQAGAAAKAMLIAAAAQTWNVPTGEITVSKGKVRHEESRQESGFGALATAAADVPVPVDVPVKDPKDFVLIGTDRPKLDSLAKTNGSADFAIDIYRDGMLTVAVAHPPKFGATLINYDDADTLAVEGVAYTHQVPNGIAVYASNTYAAFKGRDALKVNWDFADAETRSSAQMTQEWVEAAKNGGEVAEESGDFDATMEGAAKRLSADYTFPFLAHAPMEPIDGVIEIRETDAGREAEVWMGSQLQTVDHGTIAATLEIPQDRVSINTMLTGGSFGRRAQPGSPVAAELAAIAAAPDQAGSYKMLWSRSDDIRGGYYRPLTAHHLEAGLDAEGNIVAWRNNIANQSFLRGSAFEGLIRQGIDATAVEGSTKMPYKWPAHRVTWAEMQTPVTGLWWRAVGHTHTAFATEVFLDEALIAGGKDVVEGRLALITDSPRDAGVLQRLADMIDWSGPQEPNGRARGIALHESFNTYVAMAAEVSEEDGRPKVHKVWCAVDCGVAVNPNVIRAQIEGGVGYGLGAALYDAITLAEGGEVQQSNFDDYRMLRINEMPEVEVSIIASIEAPTGIGEPGTPPIAPAVANAWRG